MKLLIKLEARLSKEERKAIYRLQRSLFTWSSHLKKYLYYSSRPKWRLMLWEDNRLVGSVSVVKRRVSFAGQSLIIGGVGNLGVKREFQNKGYARFLLKRAKELIKKEEINLGLLFCGEDRTRLYKKVGYERMEKYATYYSGSKLKKERVAMFLPIHLTRKQTSCLKKKSCTSAEAPGNNYFALLAFFCSNSRRSQKIDLNFSFTEGRLS